MLSGSQHIKKVFLIAGWISVAVAPINSFYGDKDFVRVIYLITTIPEFFISISIFCVCLFRIPQSKHLSSKKLSKALLVSEELLQISNLLLIFIT